MRRLMRFMCMALIVCAASIAGAHDGAKVIYDLSELGRETLPEAPIVTGTENANWNPRSLSMRPYSSNSASDLEIKWMAGNFELDHKRGGRPAGRGSSQVPSPDPQDGFANATPNPEPGTLILMGSGLVAGARYVRRRKNR